MSLFKRFRPRPLHRRLGRAPVTPAPEPAPTPAPTLTPAPNGNGNRAVWRDMTILDGAIYRMPNGELVQASVVPHPDALPEYWEDVPGTDDAWPRGRGLTLNVHWHEEGAARGSVGPALLTFMTAARLAQVPWAGGHYVCDRDLAAKAVRDTGCGAREATWTVEQLRLATTQEHAEFAAAVKRAARALRRLTAGAYAHR